LLVIPSEADHENPTVLATFLDTVAGGVGDGLRTLISLNLDELTRDEEIGDVYDASFEMGTEADYRQALIDLVDLLGRSARWATPATPASRPRNSSGARASPTGTPPSAPPP